VTTQELQHQEVMKEIAGVKEDVKSVNDGVVKQLAEHHSRILVLETFKQTKAADDKIEGWNIAEKRVNEYLDPKRVERVDAAVVWSERLQDRWKLIVGMIALFCTAVTIILGYISTIFGLFK